MGSHAVACLDLSLWSGEETMRFSFGGEMIKKLLPVLLVGGLLASCESVEPRGPAVSRPYPDGTQQPSQPIPEVYDEKEFVTTEALDGKEPVRVALLLPFTSTSENVEKVAEAMSNAAELAVFESGNDRFLLISKDTKGTPEGARAAASEALREGAEIVLGPLFSESVVSASTLTRAAGVPMIAFSSDMNIAGNGVYLLSFPPEMEIARVTDFAVKNGYTRFGLLSPMSEYGNRVSNSFTEEAFVRGGVVVHEERYEQSPDAMLQPAKRLANYASDCSTTTDSIEGDAVTNQSIDSDPFSSPAYGTTDPYAGPGYQAVGGFQAVLMPEQGTLLRALAPLLPYYDVNVKCIKLLGVSAWNNPRLTREPALAGGWFAAPDPSLSANFKQRYKTVYGETPPRLASLAYDAALLTARLGLEPKGYRYQPNRIADPNGYSGADGLFRLNQDGTVERGLAILEIRASGIKVIDPAPASFMTVLEEDPLSDIGGLEY